ncbi:MAG: serine dehydratase subunit alpha family protein [Clostridia bacterium]|nr:serine dehydratase subunit alpha family protein [Clostridia bacterium]
MSITLSPEKYEYYVRLLREELVPAMGCTEPIAIAYAAAVAREALGQSPISAEIAVSGNIIKNAKSVVVPHTGGMRGIEAALIAGFVGGRHDAFLEVLSSVTEEHILLMQKVREALPVRVTLADTDEQFYIHVTLMRADDKAEVIIEGRHTNVVRVLKNGVTVYEGKEQEKIEHRREAMTVEEIVSFADTVMLDDVRQTLMRQISYNMAIAEEGLKNNYGANIGKVYLSSYSPDISNRAKAYAAAGSDARMNGCEMPVIINSGSGNQGMTASVPVIVYAREMGVSEDKLLRALCVSNLITLRVKSGIGTLSAYCGAVAAGAGAGCGVAYLYGGGYVEIAHTLVNALAVDSGLICDGAKASCAAKIATAVENGLLGYHLYRSGNQFFGGDGIVKKGVENTIDSIGRLARLGMRQTDREILNIMLDD